MSFRVSLLGLLAAGALGLPAAPAQAAPISCPSTFTVLHDDRIGAMAVPAGPYRLTVLDPTALSCATAADAFRRFLEDLDGKLPAPWRLDPATQTFTGGGRVGFSVAGVSIPSGGGGGQHPATGLRCPGVFQVLHNDRIGTAKFPAGDYTVTLLSAEPLACTQANAYFARFLQDFDGRLPAPWSLDPQTATFRRGSTRFGFRVEPAAGPPVPNGGGSIPEGRRCPGTFRVLHDDRIGKLALPAGSYSVTLGASTPITCSASTSALARFLQRPDGRLPSGWKLTAATGTFSRNGVAAFRIKPARAMR